MAIGALERITIVDPAVGSGAFLLGALERLATARSAPPRARQADDPSPQSVRCRSERHGRPPDRAAPVARPSWPTSPCPPERVAPLPEPRLPHPPGRQPGRPAWRPRPRAPPAARRMGRAAPSCHRGIGPPARAARAPRAGRAERLAAAAALDQREQETRRAIRALIEAARAPTLFGDRPSTHDGRPPGAGRPRATLRALRAGRRRLAADGGAALVPLPVAVCRRLRRRRFRHGHREPPWVRAEALAPAVRERLAARYRWWRSGGGRGFGHRPDLSVAFLERAHELAAPGGTVALLVPAKLAAAGYATTGPGAMAAMTTIHAVADLAGDPDAGFDATAYPMASSPRDIARARPSRQLDRDGRHRDWGRRADARSAPSTAPSRLSSRARHGCFGAAMRRVSRASWHCSMPHSPSAMPAGSARRPARTGSSSIRQIRSSRKSSAGRCVAATSRRSTRRRRRTILWTHDANGRPLERLPPAAAEYLRGHAAALRKRADFRGGPLWAVFRAGPATRAASGGVARPRAPARGPRHWRSGPTAAGATQYLLRDRDPATGRRARARGVAQQHLDGVLASLVAQPASSGYRRFGAATVGSLPSPPPSTPTGRLPTSASGWLRGGIGAGRT